MSSAEIASTTPMNALHIECRCHTASNTRTMTSSSVSALRVLAGQHGQAADTPIANLVLLFIFYPLVTPACGLQQLFIIDPGNDFTEISLLRM